MPCLYWLTTKERCGKAAEWRFGHELDMCRDHYVTVRSYISRRALMILGTRAIR